MSVRYYVQVYISVLPYYIRHCLSVSGRGRSVVYWLKLTATVYLKYCHLNKTPTTYDTGNLSPGL
jgi:hypothetical protein